MKQLPTLSPARFLVDSHCHLDMEAYHGDLETVLERAYQSHIRAVISVGIDEGSSRQAILLARKHPMVFAAIGIHPHAVGDIHPTILDVFSRLAVENRRHIVAYGEIGLDYARRYAPPEVQRQFFRDQLALAKNLQLPVIVHDREAHEDTMRILREFAPYPQGGVMHCFSGDIALAEQVISLGFFVSLPGVVTFKNAGELHSVAQLLPLTAMIVETDGPFLAPTPHRGQRNEPAFLLYTAQKIAELRGISIDEVAQQTSENARVLFQLTGDFLDDKEEGADVCDHQKPA